MKRFDTRTYSISDFIEWDGNGMLQLSPDFQRRSVWSDKAKSYLIDTVLRGKPMPKIIITQKLVGSKNVRVVVDGQQRLRAILSYYYGDFKISKAHNKDLADIYYSGLPADLSSDFLKYELGVDVLFDIPYNELLDIFARINSYTVKLSKQELFNANYLGFFKQHAYRLGFKYVNFFLDAGVLTKANVTRMGEAELTSDLLVGLLEGVQSNKTIENYYKKYEDVAGDLEEIEKRFDATMSVIGGIYNPADLKNTNYSRIHLFYSLFLAIAHVMFRVHGLKKLPKKNITPQDFGKIRIILDSISYRYDQVADNMEDPNEPKDYKDFIKYSRRGTTDTAARIYRSDFLAEKISASL